MSILKILLSTLFLSVLVQSVAANNGCWRSHKPKRIVIASQGGNGIKINTNPIQCKGTRVITYHREGIRCSNTWATGALTVNRLRVRVNLWKVEQQFTPNNEKTECVWADVGRARVIGQVIVADCRAPIGKTCPSNNGVKPDPGS